MTSDITLTDFFCGAGGSSTGAVKAGARVLRAANHWNLAIETHQTNHPTTDHDLCDLMHTHPSRFPRTTIAWFSPECRNHSIAKGRKHKNVGQMDLWGNDHVDPSEERSRATMHEVVEYTEYHHYEVVIVENVVDIRLWQQYDAWLQAMLNLGYEHYALYLNAQFFGVPQSRDRIYIVFWKKGNKRPHLDFHPPANCPQHGLIAAVQSWKKPETRWGRYGERRQYLYVCPKCGARVQPFHVPAAAAINWSIPSERIGDRRTPLKPKTMERIRAGLEKFKDSAVLIDTTFNGVERRIRAVDDVMPAQTARQTLYLLLPFISEMRNHGDGRSINDALAAITAGGLHHGLVTPPFLAILKGELMGISFDEPLSTIVASACQHWLVSPPFMLSGVNQEINSRSVDEPMYTIPASYNHARVVIPPFMLAQANQESPARSVDDPLFTVATQFTQQLVTPPYVVETGGARERTSIAVDQPLHAQLTRESMSLVTPPLIVTYNGHAVYAPIYQAMPTIRTLQSNALLMPDDLLPECGFRMLEPDELKRGMSFLDSYVILGNKRAQVKQIGNAVCPNVAEWIVARCVESLAS